MTHIKQFGGLIEFEREATKVKSPKGTSLYNLTLTGYENDIITIVYRTDENGYYIVLYATKFSNGQFGATERYIITGPNECVVLNLLNNILADWMAVDREAADAAENK